MQRQLFLFPAGNRPPILKPGAVAPAGQVESSGKLAGYVPDSDIGFFRLRLVDVE